MANQQKLTIVGYMRPGSAVGQAYNPTAVNTGNLPFIPTYIGQGSPYIIGGNLGIVRGFIYQEKLIFSAKSPFIAPLKHYGDGKQTSGSAAVVRIYNASQVEVNPKYWRFTQSSAGSPYDQVQLFDPNYNANEVYYIDYQSMDATVSDLMPVVGMRTVRYCGDRPYESFYELNHDLAMDTEVVPSLDQPVNSGTGYVEIDADTKYTAYDRTYHLSVQSGATSVDVPHLGTITITPSGLTNLVVSASTKYTGLNVDSYIFTVANVNGIGLDLNWSRSSDSITGTVHVNAATPNGVIGPDGLIFNVTVTGLANGNVLTLPVTKQTVTSVQFSWYTEDQSQSSSGLFTITNASTSKIALDSGILLNFGTMVAGNPAVKTPGTLTGFLTGDSFTFEAKNLDTINWNFTRTTTEEFTPGDVYYDALGYVTGTPRSWYVTLGNVPVGATTVVSSVNPNPPVTHTDIAGKLYVALAAKPLTNVRVTYGYRNAPGLGQTYYITTLYTRPESMYNTPITFTDYRTALAQMGYPDANNQIGVMLDYAFNVAGCPMVAVIQVADNDHDGIYNTADYLPALNAAYAKKDLTDIVVLGRFDTIADQIYNSIRSNDPLYGALRMYWIGYPTNYKIGDLETPGTICYTSSQILQVSGASPAHGTFVSVANQWVKRTVITESGASVQLNLDGSFFAGMLCALQDAQSDPNSLLLNMKVPGVDAVATFDDVEVELLGVASNTYALQPDPNNPVVTVIDVVTTDSSSADYHEVNVMKAKLVVSRNIINACNKSLVGYVPLSEQDGVNHVRSIIMNQLTAMAGEGVIGPFTDSTGRLRTMQASDVQVWRDDKNNPSGDKTRYNFTYWFNGRYGIKRLTGVYSVDDNIFA